MKGNNVLQVFYGDRIVGTLAGMKNGKIAFEYADSWLETGFSVSPFSLPLVKKVFVPVKEYFGGLFGVFADSLPDAWGQVLVNRMLRAHSILPGEASALTRLAMVGEAGMGALCYRPGMDEEEHSWVEDWDMLAEECRKLLQSEECDDLDLLYQMGGTSGGARPKVMTEWNGQHWIIKFPAHVDGIDAGKMEYDYALCAKKCGINMPEVRLFSSTKCQGYFGCVRFDRAIKGHGIQRIHMVTAAGLLEADYRQLCLDYHELMKLTRIMTDGNPEDMENMFRRACFNVFSHNRDDHAKNFSFLYYEESDMWRLSPAYDLTFSTTYYGEHTTSVDGNGRNPGKKELMNVGRMAGLKKETCQQIIEEIAGIAEQDLREYL